MLEISDHVLSNSTPRYIPKGNEKLLYTHKNVCTNFNSSIIYNNHKVEKSKYLSTDECDISIQGNIIHPYKGMNSDTW